jgi:hypothetical protein
LLTRPTGPARLYPAYAATARGRSVAVHASAGGPVVRTLANPQPSGAPLTFLLDGAPGGAWLHVFLPVRPNGSTGWVRRATLGPWHRVTTLLRVNRHTLRATLYRSGRAVWRSRIGVGAPVSPTPAGRFYIRERIANLHGPGVYGPVAFGTSDYSRLTEWPGGGIVGIHGTDQPQLLPGHVSHGCIRLPNSAVRRLSRRLRIGTPIQVI